MPGYGGRYFDNVLFQQMVEDLLSQGRSDIDAKVVAKLHKAAKKAKEVLSANRETTVYVRFEEDWKLLIAANTI